MKIVRDESGQTIVLFAVFMGLCAIGFLAIALDAGLLFREKWMARAAADAVAVAAAEEVVLGQSTTEENTVAAAVAKINGFDNSLATNPATVVVSAGDRLRAHPDLLSGSDDPRAVDGHRRGDFDCRGNRKRHLCLSHRHLRAGPVDE